MLRLLVLGTQDKRRICFCLELFWANGLVCGPVMKSREWCNVLHKNYDENGEHVENIHK